MTHSWIRGATLAGVFVVLALAAGCSTAARSGPADETSAAPATSLEQDLDQLQGRWERKLPGEDLNARRGAARAVKEIKGNRETVTYYDDAGKPVRITTAEFKLERSGRVRLYTFSNLKVTLGEDNRDEARSDKPLSYIYRVAGDVCQEGHGFLIDSPGGAPPTIARWDRAK